LEKWAVEDLQERKKSLQEEKVSLQERKKSLQEEVEEVKPTQNLGLCSKTQVARPSMR
jgi:FtsZ-binding cell division protein ZapB